MHRGRGVKILDGLVRGKVYRDGKEETGRPNMQWKLCYYSTAEAKRFFLQSRKIICEDSQESLGGQCGCRGDSHFFFPQWFLIYVNLL